MMEKVSKFRYQAQNRLISGALLGLCLWSVAWGLWSGDAFAQEAVVPVVIDGDKVTYLHEQGRVTAQGNVKMEHEDTRLFCDEADYDTKANTARINGNVRVEKGKETVIYGEDVVYDFNTQKAQVSNIRLESPPYYGQARQGEKVDEDKYVFKQGHITTCDLKEPHYRLVAKRIIVYPGDRVVAKHLFMKIGKIPVFYLPYFSHSLKDRSFPMQIAPGDSKEWGYYMLTRWRYHLNAQNRGKIHTDWYEKRGQGLGITHKMEDRKLGEGLLKYYRLQDKMYELDKRNSLFEMYSEREGTIEKYLEDDRYLGEVFYEWEPRPRWSVKGEFNKFSDAYFRKDFFYREYEAEPSPATYLLIDYALDWSSLSLFMHKRANNFLSAVEYLPRLEYNFYQQRLAKSNFYLESKTTAVNLASRAARSNVRTDLGRVHSHNVLSYVKNIKWFYINPFGGAYTTFYSRNVFGDKDVWRVAPEAGIDLNTKLYKVFNASFSALGEKVDRMRHIITPRISYHYIHPPTVSRSHLFQFDGVDNLIRQEKIVFTLDNKLQARNDSRTWDFLYFSPAVDYIINQKGRGSYFNTVSTTFEIYPKKGIGLTAKSVYTISTRRHSTVNADLNIGSLGEKSCSLTLGHRYSRGSSTQGVLNLTYQLTPKLQFRHYLRYEYNDKEFQEQEHGLRVDLHCWWMDIGINKKKSLRTHYRNDFSVWVEFTLKAFPEQVRFGYDRMYHGGKNNY